MIARLSVNPAARPFRPGGVSVSGDAEALQAPSVVKAVIATLEAAEPETFRARDILRAAGLDPLPADNVHVAESITKSTVGEGISPVLLLRGNHARGLRLLIMPGFHRVCAAYHLDEDAEAPCRIADVDGE